MSLDTHILWPNSFTLYLRSLIYIKLFAIMRNEGNERVDCAGERGSKMNELCRLVGGRLP